MWKGALPCVASLCAVIACDGSGPALPARVATITRAFDTALFECADRVWPGTAESYRGSQVLLVSLQAGKAYLWNDQREASAGGSAPVTVMDTADLEQQWLSTFNRGTLLGFPTLSMSLDETARIDKELADAGASRWHDFAVELGLHEAFHFIGSQPQWPLAGGAGTRFIPYPQAVEPRHLRAALASSLLAYVRDGAGDAALAAAAFWQGRFVTEHQADADAIRDTDVREGAAEYATIAGSALVEHGCAASEATFVQTMVAHVDDFVYVAAFDGGSEPYQLGVLAGLAARMRGEGAAGWQARVERGETPVDVLIGNVAPVVQVDDPALIAAAGTAVDASNRAISEEVTPLLARMQSPDYVRLAIPTGWMTVGSFGVAGFVTLVEEPDSPQVLLRYRATHQTPEAGSTITVAQTVIDTRAEACGAVPIPMRVATFPAGAAIADTTTGRFTLNSPELSFAGLPVDLIQDAAGLTWMCPRL
jgi:hypothetical protein